jgi:hypothetical protein
MAYSPQDLKEIRDAERAVYELYFSNFIGSLSRYISANKLEITVGPERGVWIEDRALRTLDRWRSHFCPGRVGLPLESNWTP